MSEHVAQKKEFQHVPPASAHQESADDPNPVEERHYRVCVEGRECEAVAGETDMSQTQKDYQRPHNTRPKQIDLLAAYRTLFVAYVRNHSTEANERFVERMSSAATNNGVNPTSDVATPVKR